MLQLKDLKTLREFKSLTNFQPSYLSEDRSRLSWLASASCSAVPVVHFVDRVESIASMFWLMVWTAGLIALPFTRLAPAARRQAAVGNHPSLLHLRFVRCDTPSSVITFTRTHCRCSVFRISFAIWLIIFWISSVSLLCDLPGYELHRLPQQATAHSFSTCCFNGVGASKVEFCTREYHG